MTVAMKQVPSAEAVALAYHARTKHSLQRYAAGPEALDWDMQPNPFREFEGCKRTPLALAADLVGRKFKQVYAPNGDRPTPLDIAAVGVLLELSMGLSAWKEYGPDRWALRCNPSSGNLHPTEAYIVSNSVPGLDDGLHHYLSCAHALEQRCRSVADRAAPARLWIGLASVHWREAWKYGERAFRYCQLDIGHALGAIRYAAGVLGWTAKVVDGVTSDTLAALMGLDRAEDFAGVEPEDADILIAIEPRPEVNSGQRSTTPYAWAPGTGEWAGRANLLDPHPLYRWPVIDQVTAATLGCSAGAESAPLEYPPLHHESEARAADIIFGRRSAQRFDSKFTMSTNVFHRLLDRLLARKVAPWDLWGFAPRIHPIFFIHRVEGLEPGLYALPRHPGTARSLREHMRSDFEWRTPEYTPSHIPFVRLLPADCRAIAKTINCHQAIASDGCFSLSMLSEFEPVVSSNAWRYRQLHWEAGLLGHVLYLETEAAGLRGTGIGCFFDDAMHEVLGIRTAKFQALYHFTVGRPLTDDRITTLPAYAGRPNHNKLEEEGS